MNERKSNHGNEGPEHEQHAHEVQAPYWTRAHRDWRFWVGFTLMSVAITVFVLSDNLALLRHP